MNQGFKLGLGIGFGIAVVLLAAYVVALMSCGLIERGSLGPAPVSSSPPKQRPQGPASTVANQDIYPVTITDMYRSFEDNELNAEDWLRGRRISITGKALTVGAIGSGWAVAVAPLDAEPTTPEPVGASFYFDSSSREIAKSIHAGEIVTCVGTYKGRDLGGIFAFTGEGISDRN